MCKHILFYASHPAQYLFLRHTVRKLRQNGNKVTVVIKTKDILEELLQKDGEKYINILPNDRKDNRLSIFFALLKRDVRLAGIVRKQRPDLLIGTDASLAHVGRLTGIPCITSLEDDYEVIRSFCKLTYPFTTAILVPEVCRVGPYVKKKIGYQGYMKLGYLHPNVFTPDRKLVEHALTDKMTFLIRSSKLGAHHDFGVKGLTREIIIKLIDRLKKYGNVYISSEKELDSDLKPYELKLDTQFIHHMLYYSDLLICDSQSMAVEASLLGTPSVRFSDFAGKISVLEELEHHYDLTYGIPADQPERLFKKIDALLSIGNLKAVWLDKQRRMLADKIDVSAFLEWFITNYPQSVRVMNDDPDYQFRFR